MNTAKFFSRYSPSAIKIAFIFLAFSILWIHLSDHITLFLFRDVQSYAKAQTLKGWLFVFITSLFIFLLIERRFRQFVRVEDDLRKSENYLSSVFRAAPTGMGVVRDHVFRSVNNRLCEMTGYSSEELLGCSCRMFYPSDDEYDHARKNNEELMRSDIITFETRWRRKDGSFIDVLMSTTFINSKEPDAGITFTALDITERNRSEQILQLFIKHAPAAIAMFDMDMRYIAASQRYLSDYGIEGRNIIGRSHYDVFPEIPERWKEIYSRCLSGQSERCEQDPFHRASGKTDFIRWEILPWFEQESRIGGIILFSEVVTEQVEALKKLKESEAKFRNLFEEHTAVKLIIEPDSGAIIEANDSAARFYGWPAEQLRRMKIQDLNTLPPEKIWEEMEKARDQQRNCFEFSHRLADGSTREVEVFSSKIVIQEKVYLHSIVHDISDRKNAEQEQKQLREQLAQAQKLESIGLLAGGVAHDYNNMMSVIIGFAELAMEKLPADDPVHQDLAEILKATDRSVRITQQLLAFARKQKIHPVVLDLNEAIAGTLKMLRRLIGEDIDLNWQPHAGLWAVKMDRSQVDQFLTNMCVNARDAISGVGRVTIETENVTFDKAYCANHFHAVPGDFVMVALSDTGSGIDKDTLDHIFEPFFTTKEVGQGTGLGLATVYGIVKQNNGFIDVSSAKETGTTFRLYFPRHMGVEDGVDANRAAALPRADGEKVLVVDDEDMIGNICRSMLEVLGYEALVATTPNEAMRLAEENSGTIDLLVTDLIMPEMNGRDLADKLQSLWPTLKILFMSGYTQNVTTRYGILDDEVNFIPKPFSLKDLALKVREALNEDSFSKV